MATTRIRSVDLLPEIFRTETNKKFLASTLDQMIQPSRLQRVEGYVGRGYGLGVNPADNYVLEPNKERTDYQLEPAITYKVANTDKTRDLITYPELLDAIQVHGGDVSRHDRLFSSEFYSWDPFVDYDKFVNFGQYYWLSSGPDPVDVQATEIATSDSYAVTRLADGYNLEGQAGDNPTITLVRGGNYTFEVEQTGNPFWIQASPGTDGTLTQTPNISARTILGVTNNGEDNGTVTFNVPDSTAQNFYYNLNDLGDVDLATDLKFDQINNRYVDEFLADTDGIDQIRDLDGRTLIFLSRNTETDPELSGWRITDQFDNANFDTTNYAQETAISTSAQRYSVWRIEYVAGPDGRNYIKLNSTLSVPQNSKVEIQYGTVNSSRTFWKNAEGFFEEQPLLTATMDQLWYQDGNDATKFGVIKIVDQADQLTLDVEDDIVGKTGYTSPNGVEFTNGLKVKFRGATEPADYQDKEYYVEGVGTAIKLLAVADFKTPEEFTNSETLPFDSTAYDASPWDESLNAPKDADYYTINRASLDKNAWTRSNRWFHVDVINKTAEYNNSVAILDQNLRAKRPVVEFKAGLRLYNYGTLGKEEIDIIDLNQTDALSNVNGKVGYSTNGYALVDGSRVIFANDLDPEVRNKIYQVELIDEDGVSSTDKIINLTVASDGVVATDDVVYLSSGATLQGKTYRYNGTSWVEAQQKTTVNQAPLFDIFDVNGRSLGDNTYYPSTNFKGTKLFSYAEGSGAVDPILNQRLKYLNIDNVGDIVFDNNLEKDTFTYTVDSTSTTKSINFGFVHNYSSRTAYDQEIGWKKHNNKSIQYQALTFTWAGVDLVCDVPAKTSVENPVIVYVNNVYQEPSRYSYTVSSTQTTVTFATNYIPKTGDNIVIQIQSDVASSAGFYEVPDNLANNSPNGSFNDITLGTIRNHYIDLAQHITKLSGQVLGKNNIRDLGDVVPYGNKIVQQGSPLQLAATFTRDSNINFFEALNYASREYEKYKWKLIESYSKNDFQGTIRDQLDQAIQYVNEGKENSMPFYWSDTIPCGDVYTETKYTVTAIDDAIFDLTQTYDFTKANYRGLLVYLNDVQLLKDTDYTVPANAARINISATLNTGDVLVIREYETTAGSYLPATPTTLGMYGRWNPEIVTDNTYVEPQTVVIGHDGSRTVGFGDTRDDLLLEFEKRIYNNIKVSKDDELPLKYEDVAPGKFRTTDYTQTEITEILGTDFLSWVAWNRLDYKAQTYDANDQKTWNYSSAEDTVDGELLLGHWRGIFNEFYDTDTPHTHPWEMIGFTAKPTWWNNKYGPAPYTSGNEVLWDDLEAGRVWDGVDTYTVDPRYKRPGLTSVIPVDDEGNLRTAFDTMTGKYDSLSLKKSWVVGDHGPVETVWRRSSSWAFSVMRLLALTKPAEFFALYADRDLYKRNTALDQIVWDGRSRIRAEDITIYGANTPKHSYINWSVDYARKQGIDTNTEIKQVLENMDVQLVYKMASYSDKEYLKVFTEKTSPNSNNTSLLLPDESYEIFLHNNEVFDTAEYSSVIIQKTDDGWAVYGNSKLNPYFEIFTSIPNGNYKTVQVGSESVRVSSDFETTTSKVPYGYVFTNRSTMCDFLISYGRALEAKGMVFDDTDNNYLLDWTQMIREFLYWSQQGWTTGSLININPNANKLYLERSQAVVAPIIGQTADDFILNQNLRAISNSDLVFNRQENQFEVKTTNENAISYARMKMTSYEHVLVFDNKSIFNDLIYDPITGSRQNRLKLVGYNTGDWNGNIEAQGFIFNFDNVVEWSGVNRYSKGDIVLYKNVYYTAGESVPPSDKFDYSKWLETEYDRIKKGLLPNLSLKADQLRDYYDHNIANLEADADQLGFHLVGFTERDYLANMGLSDISQVRVYENFIGNKGTSRAVDLFKSARLPKELATYNVSENWAVKQGTYGASANRSFYELRLDETKMSSNPSTIALSASEQLDVDQTVVLSDIYKQSYKISSANVLPTTDYVSSENNLPTAGYVNTDDVDIQTWNLDNLGLIAPFLETLGEGTTIWVAKDNTYDWNIYRASIVEPNLLTVTDNLDGTSTLAFRDSHGLAKNDIIVVRFFDAAVNFAYRVQSVPALHKVVINQSLPTDITFIESSGIVFKLNSVRVAQPSDVANLPFVNELDPGNRVWVDDNGNDGWQVLEKTNPFTKENSFEPYGVTENSLTDETLVNTNFGASVAQNAENLTALVGADNYDSGTGAVFTFVETANNEFAQNSILTGGTVTNLEGYGNDVAMADETWAVVGASESNNGEGYVMILKQENTNLITEHQLIVNPSDANDEAAFGHAVAISDDGRWMYASAPGKDSVYAFQRVDRQLQRFTTTGDGSTTQYDLSDFILADEPDQIAVVVNNVELTAGVDYTFTSTVSSTGRLSLTTAPEDGKSIAVTRRESVNFEGDGSTTEFDISGLYTADGEYSITVFVNGVLQRLNIDYDFAYDSSDTFAFATAPADGATIVVRSSDYFEYVSTIVGTKGEDFGYSIATTTDGRQVLVGAKLANGQGKVYVYDRDVERFVVTDDTDKTYQTDKSPLGRATVSINSEYISDSSRYFGGAYTISGSTVTLATAPNIGDFVEVETNNFLLLDTIEKIDSFADAEFGYDVTICPTNCSVYASAPSDGLVGPYQGSVQRSVNQSRLYGTITGTTTNPTVTQGDKIRINNVVVEFTGTTLDQVVTDINNAIIPNVTASKTNNKLTISLTNINAGEIANKLYVYPAGDSADALDDLGLEIFKNVQTITSPEPVNNAYFGQSLSVSSDALTLVVGSPRGVSKLPTTFDSGTTEFDGNATEFKQIRVQSGSVYTFDYLGSAPETITNPGKLAFGQQIADISVGELSEFGHAVDYRSGSVIVTSPGHEANDNSSVVGRIAIWNNLDRAFAWKVIREEASVVDIEKINAGFIYDRLDKEIKTTLDHFDPLQGKILGAVRQNIDIITATDPAQYNQGAVNNSGQTWGKEHVGKIWWDIENIRFINYYQGDPEYRAKRWGQVFPGSTAELYEWVESSQPPANYAGAGTVLSQTSYSVRTNVAPNGTIETKYYFWVKDNPALAKGKTLSSATMKAYIEDPKSSGIAYFAPLSGSTVALYNTASYLSARDRIMHIEFDKVKTDNNVHVEYELIKTNDPTEFLSTQLYKKFVDSYAGSDSIGNKVPDPFLSEADAYGVEFRPRQSMFEDRFKALKNYITRANAVFVDHPITEMRTLEILSSEEQLPAAGNGAWDKKLNTYDELTYQDLRLVATGYKYLVVNDSNNGNLWTIYEVQADDSLLLTRVQNYKTSNYWSYVDWYATGYSNLDKPKEEVATYSRLATVESTVSTGDIVKVTANADGKFELYERTTTGWDRIGLEDGTIAIDSSIYDYSLGRNGFDVEVFDAQYFDAEPVLETRQIIKSINDEILIDDLADHRIDLINLTFEYIKSEQTAVNWLMKTSLVDIQHTLRDLIPYDILQTDNQEFVEKYIEEVKPYHVQIKEFTLKYNGDELFQGDATDFDLPAQYDTVEETFISPRLSDDGAVGSYLGNSAIWTSGPYTSWYNNYSLSVDSVTITASGSGYLTAPTVTVTGTATTTAVLKARINTAGQVVEIEVVNAGEGYTEPPTITISGGSGSGATAVAITSPGAVRSYKTTIKYDRYEYQSEIVDWTAGTTYDAGDLVRYNNKVYRAKNEDDSTLVVSGATFDPDDFEVVTADELTGVNRTRGFYAPAVNEPGIDLGLLINGIDYPGVRVEGPTYDQNTGFDVGNYDINPWDNLDFGDEGRPSYSETILDTKYAPGDYTDTYLGTLATDINVDGGAYIDTYSSHSPEELVPSSIFDTLNIKVFTRPGFDYDGDGHGAPYKSEMFEYDGTETTFSFANLTENPFAVRAFNVTTGLTLRFEYVSPAVNTVDYTVDWKNKTITFNGNGISVGDILRIESYGIGGGDQLWVDNYNVADYLIDDSSEGLYIDVPVKFEEIYEAMIKCNGSRITNYTFSSIDDYTTRITFGTQDMDGDGNPDPDKVKYFGTQPLTEDDYLHVAIFGYDGDDSTVPGYITHDESLVHTSSHPTSQIIYADGTSTDYELENDIQGHNAFTAVVEVDGKRLTPAEGIEYTADGSSEGPFYLNVRNWKTTEDLFQTLIADNEVHVFVGYTKLKLYEDYTVSAVDGSSVRYVVLNETPAAGTAIKIFVETAADYKISFSGEPESWRNRLIFNTAPINGARVLVTTDNNTSELDLLTKCFNGPTAIGQTATVGFDQLAFDSDTFDETVGSVVDLSQYDLDRTITRPDRLRVTVNGLRKYFGRDWRINADGQTLEFLSTTVSDNDIVVVTLQTEKQVPDTLDFSIFKDMRDNNAIYRINGDYRTTLTQALTATADTIYVKDASKLSAPDLANNVFGQVIIDGERITYRERDVTNNTLSGLRRGVAGTGADSHAVTATVYDHSAGTYLDYSYSKTMYELPTVDDGSTVRTGKSLQDANTVPAKFLRGENS